MKHLHGLGTLGALLGLAGWASVSCSSDSGNDGVTGTGGSTGLNLGTGGGTSAAGGTTGTGIGGSGVTSSGGTASGTTAVVITTGPSVLCVLGAKLVSDLLIDDCNDNNNQIHNGDQRMGYWYTFNDATVGATAQSPLATSTTPMTSPGYDGDPTGFGFYTTGGGYTEWGAGFGFSFVDGGGKLMCPYDASVATGVSFYYKSDVATRLIIRMRSTVPIADHGDCSVGNACNNPHGVALAPAADWTLKSVLWSDLAVDPSWGWTPASPAPAFDPSGIVDMQVKIPQSTGLFNVSIDQIEFTQ